MLFSSCESLVSISSRLSSSVRRMFRLFSSSRSTSFYSFSTFGSTFESFRSSSSMPFSIGSLRLSGFGSYPFSFVSSDSSMLSASSVPLFDFVASFFHSVGGVAFPHDSGFPLCDTASASASRDASNFC